jgi:hypothetical protein
VIGFNHCGYDFSTAGRPGEASRSISSCSRGHTADACNPTATFDTDGNAYVGGVLFDIASPASVRRRQVERGHRGAFYHTPAPLSFQTSHHAARCGGQRQ